MNFIGEKSSEVLIVFFCVHDATKDENLYGKWETDIINVSGFHLSPQTFPFGAVTHDTPLLGVGLLPPGLVELHFHFPGVSWRMNVSECVCPRSLPAVMLKFYFMKT